MTACPQCNKPLRDLVRRCPSCQADLDLLVDYVSHLSGGLQRAENLTRAGELGEAVWAYLEVLETDPDNAAARKQVSRVVTAVRQFDASTPARKMAVGLPVREDRSWLSHLPSSDKMMAGLAILFFGFILGMIFGFLLSRGPVAPVEDEKLLPAPVDKNQMLGR